MKLKINFITFLLLAFSLVGCGSSSKDEPNNPGNQTSAYLELKSSVPANGATDVKASKIELTFNKVAYLKNQANINLDGKAVIGVEVVGPTAYVTLPTTEMGKQYTLNVKAGAFKNAQGDENKEFSISFTTAAYSCDVAPDKTGVENDNKTLASKLTIGWNLGNSLEAYNEGMNEDETETAWGNPKATEAMIVAVKKAGFNVLRVPVRWYPHCDEVNGELRVHDKWMKRVKEVVDYGISQGMYVILNVHHELWAQSHPFYADAAAIEKKETSLWRQIAKAFASYDEHLIFAGINEVHLPDYWGEPTKENLEVQNNFNKWFVEAVRSTGGKNTYRNLILQTYAGNPSYGLQNKLIIPSDVVADRLMIEYHSYVPADYALEGKVYYWGKDNESKGISSYGQEDYHTSLFNEIAATWVNKGYPVIMGEYGVTHHYQEADKIAQEANRKYYMTFITRLAKSLGIVPIVWDNNGKGNGAECFGIFDRNDNMKVVDQSALDGIMEGLK